jgi:hypothetical protein
VFEHNLGDARFEIRLRSNRGVYLPGAAVIETVTDVSLTLYSIPRSFDAPARSFSAFRKTLYRKIQLHELDRKHQAREVRGGREGGAVIRLFS